MNPIISIIVPIYKVELYLSHCIDSILTQTFEQWELLLIDDGSPDRSGEICDDYAKKDRRIRVFHKENGGVSSARNLGLEKMQGEYVTFVDADDCLYTDALDSFIKYMKAHDLSLAQCDFSRDYKACNNLVKRDSAVLNAKDYIRKRYLSVCVGGGVLRSSIIKEHSIRFEENVRLGEDQIFIYDYMLYSTKNLRIGKALYFYRDNEESAVHNPKLEYVLESIKGFTRLRNRNYLSLNQCDKMFLEFFITLSGDKNIELNYIRNIFKNIKIHNCRFATIKGKIIFRFYKLSLPLTVHLIRLFVRNSNGL